MKTKRETAQRRALKGRVKKGDLLTADTINHLRQDIERLEANLQVLNHQMDTVRGRQMIDATANPLNRPTPALNAWVSRDPAAFNHGTSWDPADVRRMLSWHDVGCPLSNIARKLGRTPFSAFCKLLKEGNGFDAMKRNALTEDNVYKVMAEIAVAKGLVKWA